LTPFGCAIALLLITGSAPSPGHAQASDDTFTGPSGAAASRLLRRSGLVPALPPAVSALERFAALELGGDVVANDPTGDTPENTTQSETTLAVLGTTLCAGYNNSAAGGFSGLSRSTNLGVSWTQRPGLDQSGDPVIAVHRASGTFYYAEIATVGGNDAIGVATSTDDCQTFGAPVDASPVASAAAATTFNDKPWIAVDNTGGADDGNLYVCWTRFFTQAAVETSELRVSRSTDGGATFVDEQVVAAAGTAPFGCSIAVGPAGQIYLVWADRTGATMNDIRFSRSTDAGQTYSTPVSIATGIRHPGVDTIVTCPTGANPAATRPTLTGDIRMLHQAWLAVDATGGPFNGNLYVVYASDPVGTPDNSDVFFIRSTDGGGMWSAPMQIGGGGGATDQFEPFVTVGGVLGTVAVAWYDRRNDPANNTLIDVYTAFSRDGGVTVDPIVRVTGVNFGVPPINPNFDPGVVNCYMGEYIAIAADEDHFYYLWGDNRNTVTSTAFPAGRLDPDVFFDSQPVPSICFGEPPTIYVRFGMIVGGPDDGKPHGGVLRGTPGADVIVGTLGPDLIKAYGGDDVICTLGGDDIIEGGSGNDQIDGGPGDDLIKGQAGHDTILGGDDDDTIEGGDGDDQIDGGPGINTLLGQGGTDTCVNGSTFRSCNP
jgi:Ca2+-binding RTX toxin-like protein